MPLKIVFLITHLYSKLQYCDRQIQKYVVAYSGFACYVCTSNKKSIICDALLRSTF